MAWCQHHTKLRSKYSTLLAPSWNWSQICWWRDPTSCRILLFPMTVPQFFQRLYRTICYHVSQTAETVHICQMSLIYQQMYLHGWLEVLINIRQALKVNTAQRGTRRLCERVCWVSRRHTPLGAVYVCDKSHAHVPLQSTLPPVEMINIILECQVSLYYSNVIYLLLSFLERTYYSFRCSRSKCCKLLFVQFILS